jgi:hypothetical protein
VVKLSEIDIGTKDIVLVVLSAAAGYYARKPIEEKRREEELKKAELYGRTAAEYVASEIKKLGFGPEAYKAIDDLTATLKEVKEVLKHYREEK